VRPICLSNPIREEWVLGRNLFQALPFSSFPKYAVHLSLRASLPIKRELFLHLLEQNHRIEPSFLMNIMPVPGGKSCPQNEHFLGLGKVGSSGRFVFLSSVDFLCFSFGFSEHKYVLGSYWTFDVSRYDASFVFSF